AGRSGPEWLVDPDHRPPLFHGTAQRPQRGGLLPQRQPTDAGEHLRNTPDAGNCMDIYFFSTPDIAEAYLYAFKVDCLEDRYCYMCRGGVMALPKGGSVPLAIVSDKDQFLVAVKSAAPSIYKLPTAHEFLRVRDKTGHFFSEWVTSRP